VGANCDINQASKQAIKQASKQHDKTWKTLQPGVEGNELYLFVCRNLPKSLPSENMIYSWF